MSVASSGTGPSIIDYGVGSGGLNTQAIISAELQPFQAPETRLQTQQLTINSNVSEYQQINTDLLNLQTQAMALSSQSGWNARLATSSNPSVATATAADGTPAGSVQFTVSQLATASSLISSGTVSSTSQIVTSASSVLVAAGVGQIGVTSMTASSGLTLGAHTIEVTQASQAASSTGTVALASQTSGIAVTGGTGSINVTVDGTAYSLALAPSPTGGYSGSGLLSAVQSAIASAGASSTLAAGYDSSGHLILSTVNQGSSQSLQITGGTDLAALGLSSATTASTGVDGVVQLDGTSTTLTNVGPGGSVTLNGASGTSVTATLVGASSQTQVNSSLLSTGTVTATNVSTGNGSLADVVANINAANTGVAASSIQTGANQYVLSLTSAKTGSNSTISVTPGAFSGSSLGSMNVASVGQNAEIQIGGTGGYVLQSQTDTFSGLLPGLSVSVAGTSSTPVTVTVGTDTSTISGKVKSLVDAANTVLSDVQTYAGYNQTTKTGGPLMGSAVLASVTHEIQSIFASVNGASSLANARSAGITLSGGQLAFDQTAFASAFAANPTAVTSLFTQGGTLQPTQAAYTGQVTVSYAPGTVQAGSYDVVVNQSATQATASGSVLTGGAVTTGEQLTISSGSNSVNYSTSAGQSLTSIAAGLNQAFATAGLSVSAKVSSSGQQLQLISDGYGSSSGFTVTSSSTSGGTTGLSGTFSGTDVAGTINGVAATGSGQFLTAPPGTPAIGGLSLQVTTSGITSATDLGPFKYTPGVAESLLGLTGAMSDPVKGAITQTIQGLQQESTGLNSQISMYAHIVSEEQTLLTNQYAALDATLSKLSNQSSTLAMELAQVAANTGATSSSSSSGSSSSGSLG
ncbi:flagellar filament capping protein FliD [Acidiferrimicrobium sp. IK]|uniref:flagellar filament capping protein FliD n=1 Tax=Acidiferrimicrobium sp. IK TaxID=2871700 RepID=UPI0021CB7F61|nr:flagellar filament capping protein FliD [Acidiferrimicrobium sp. IK]MCU4185022.1 flagellar filament capping protein FliD [Acidiferrimicrobium sp. IK]